MKNLILATAIALLLVSVGLGGPQSDALVFNGSFDQDANGDNIPDGWASVGRADIDQKLSVVKDPERGTVAQLTCAHFVPGFPDSHVMLAQLNHVGAHQGQWYRLRLWARAENLKAGAVQVSLVNRVRWHDVGLADSLVPSQTWEQFEFSFQAKEDLKPQESRLQIWFTSTGTLEVSDVKMEAIAELRRQWHPQLPLTGVVNALPNSGFECGGAGWGCATAGLPGWGGEVFSLLGQWDSQRVFEGWHSWKLSLDPQTLPVCYFDYFEPMASPIKVVLLGHQGWIPVERGKPYTFSAYVAADRPGLTARMVCRQADGRRTERTFQVAQDWTRIQLSFTAQTDFACGLVGLDLTQAARPEGTLWLDALQWEAGSEASPYRPRQSLEGQVETDRLGNIFTDPDAGLTFRLRAFNASEIAETLDGVLSVTDYLDRSVWQQDVSLSVSPKQAAQIQYDHVLAGRRGFFRVHWQPRDGLVQTLRCAVIEPSSELDSVFGMNHAFSWKFLLDLSHLAGVCWWRDWSVKWHTVQPQPDGFDFHVPDQQIDRVLDDQGQVLVLLPFPSAPWATQPDTEKIKQQAGNDRYLQQQLIVAGKPRHLEDFAAYVRATVQHYHAKVHAFEILNEPLYTTYAIPSSFGYTTSDYIGLLRTAYETAKAVDPNCTVVGGIASPPDSKWVGEFIEQGGLAWCDAMNIHLYPHRGAPDAYEMAFRQCAERIKTQGKAKPIWVTEFGCYGDDDPAFTPFAVGDNSMNASLRPNELRAGCDLIKFAVIFCAAGARKIFYHAGTCAALNEDDAGNIFFEYGGAPRKQYAAQAALSRLLGPDVAFVRKWTEPAGLQAFEFHSWGRTVVVLWTQMAGSPPVDIPRGYRAFDLMGNRMEGPRVVPTEVPMYLVGN